MSNQALIKAKKANLARMQAQLANLELEESQSTIPHISLKADKLAREIARESRILKNLMKRL